MIPHHSRIDEPATWKKFSTKLCRDCHASCCSLPVEVSPTDLIRMELMDEFELQDNMKSIAKRLGKQGAVEHFSQKTKMFTLTRLANGDCLYLDRSSRQCTIYEKRPDTCRNHPKIGPRSGFCAYTPKKS
ncbi:YkgJ family cysteine cluster protein [Desulfopila aestuarii]|uniref:Zinc-or iron-chelating domain-containing protein n=1 Tax=Desulfopila aestuarii DSM 18488 TaxID=1121416 RepID=A0A1M7Y357_9BACT|nr:hypothetical protein SAMN02745220_01545 [Desulfopila aestuarii DSM 18488]